MESSDKIRKGEIHGDGSFDELFWDGLLLHIEEHRVIPVIGPGMLTVSGPEGAEPLYQWSARQLAQRLRVDMPAGRLTLNDVVCRHLENHGDPADVYIALATIFRQVDFQPPEALRQLAAITDFNLFVSTTFDSLITEALRATRPPISPRVLAYSPGKVTDLPAPLDQLDGVTVYHLFGKVGPTPSYAVSDEDWLEFMCRLQSPLHSPEILFAELASRHLLVLGCEFADWLDRLFLRTTRRCKLSDRRDVREVLADERSASDADLIHFLSHFSRNTKLYQAGGGAAFVSELFRRWQSRQPQAGPASASGPSRFVPPAADMPPGAVFLSYTRKDLEAVKQLKSGLDAAGLPVWFDMSDLEPGDDFSRKIQDNIKRSAAFVPVISSNTEARREAFFYREWKWAIDRQDGMAGDARFILPVVIDETTRPGMRVPKRIGSLHWSRLPGGRVDIEFVAAVDRVRTENLE